MNDQEKINYFNSNLLDIFTSEHNNKLDFIVKNLDNNEILQELKTWPNEIKVKIVERHLLSK